MSDLYPRLDGADNMPSSDSGKFATIVLELRDINKKQDETKADVRDIKTALHGAKDGSRLGLLAEFALLKQKVKWIWGGLLALPASIAAAIKAFLFDGGGN